MHRVDATHRTERSGPTHLASVPDN
jgi:hypothetical protein